MSAPFDERSGKLEMADFPGRPVQLHQRHLELGVATDPFPLAGAKFRLDPRHETPGNRHEAVVAQASTPGNRGLDQMAGNI